MCLLLVPLQDWLVPWPRHSAQCSGPFAPEVGISTRTGQLPLFIGLLSGMCVYGYVFTHSLSLSHTHTYICSRMLFFEGRIFLFQCTHLKLFMLFFNTYIFPLQIERLSQILPCYIIFPSMDKIVLLLIYLANVSLNSQESMMEREANCELLGPRAACTVAHGLAP